LTDDVAFVCTHIHKCDRKGLQKGNVLKPVEEENKHLGYKNSYGGRIVTENDWRCQQVEGLDDSTKGGVALMASIYECPWQDVQPSEVRDANFYILIFLSVLQVR
jgi:hypothetical protein